MAVGGHFLNDGHVTGQSNDGANGMAAANGVMFPFDNVLKSGHIQADEINTTSS